jgi:hypothetical protein
MNREFNYQRLLNISNTQEPYKGSDNRFPFSNRKYGHKYFLCYWYRNDPVTEPHVFGIVRSDNTIEFAVEGHYIHQGLRQIMSANYYRGYFSSSIRHGGIIYSKQDIDTKEWKTIPIFKGLRMNIDTLELHEDSKYTFAKKTINRQKSKAVLDKYENAFKVAEVMFINMDRDKVRDVMNDVGREYFPECWVENGNYSYIDMSGKHYDEVMQKAITLLDTNPFDAYMIFTNVLNIWWRHRDDMKDNFTRAKKKIFKAMRVYYDVFNVKEYDHTHNLLGGEWELDVKVNGNLVHRYK